MRRWQQSWLLVQPSEFQAEQLRRSALASARVAALWRKMGPVDNWSSIAGQAAAVVTTAQLASARGASSFAASRIGAGVGEIQPEAFAGAATDVDNLVYLPLDSYLYSAVVHTRESYGPGVSDANALTAGESWLRGLVQSQVADAARNVLGAAVAKTPRSRFYRVISPPCCQRCAQWAGEVFAWNSTFSRHPRCDCMQGPILEGERPQGADIALDDIRGLSQAQRQAIEDGADLNAVVNAQRGIVRRTLADSSTVKLTTEGTTKRGWYSYVQRDLARQRGEAVTWTATQVRGRTVSRLNPRLTPEAIYQFSSSREEAVRLLARNGYINASLADIRRLAGVA